MKKQALGKNYRNGMSLVELMRMFPDDEAAEKWFIKNRWSGGIECPRCSSQNIQEQTTHPTMRHRCRSCRKFFSVKSGTVMESSNLGYQVWALAFYLPTTNFKGVSSMKLHRDLDITQKAAWHLAHRIRETYIDSQINLLSGEVEVDETYMGGLEKNKHESKKLKEGRGTVGKTAVIGAKDRDANKVKADVIENVERPTLHGFIQDNVEEDSTVFTDDFRSYRELKNFYHEFVRHSAGAY